MFALAHGHLGMRANLDEGEPMRLPGTYPLACMRRIRGRMPRPVALAYDYFGEAALLDLDDLQHNTRDGVHVASLAGACIVAIAGFGGLRDSGGKLSFVPSLPHALTRLAFNLRARKTTRLRIEVEPTQPPTPC